MALNAIDLAIIMDTLKGASTFNHDIQVRAFQYSATSRATVVRKLEDLLLDTKVNINVEIK